MRIRHRVTFSPPLAGPLDARARGVETSLAWHGFTQPVRAGEHVFFGEHSGFSRSSAGRAVAMVGGGAVRLDPAGRHADVELEYPNAGLIWRAAAMTPFVVISEPWWAHAVALAVIAGSVLQWRHSVRVIDDLVRAAAQGAP